MAANAVNNSIAMAGYLPEIEPVTPIIGGLMGNKTEDIDDIDYQKVKEYEEKIFGSSANKDDDTSTKSVLEKGNNEQTNNLEKDGNSKFDDNSEKAADPTKPTKPNGKPLSAEEEHLVNELERIDTEVKAHEAAHLAAAGGLAKGGASYTYTQGPDGKQYATGGEVNIGMETDPSNPDKTIANMEQVIASAMAPADPSGQDYSVAASARKIIADMRMQKMKESTETDTDNNSNTQNSNSNNSVNNTCKTNNIFKNTTPSVINSQLDTYKKYNNINTLPPQGQITNFVA
jgi:hypothetical protein